jgi:hypothetical protein
VGSTDYLTNHLARATPINHLNKPPQQTTWVAVASCRLLARRRQRSKDLHLASAEFAEVEADLQRARTAAALRRVRVGNREFTKLDWLEVQLPRLDTNPFDPDELGAAIAGTLHSAVTSHALARAERTLLCAFGGYGFAVDASGARQGGASPEEVFVPCYSQGRRTAQLSGSHINYLSSYLTQRAPSLTLRIRYTPWLRPCKQADNRGA